MKRFISLMLVALMLVALIPFSAFDVSAATYKVAYQNGASASYKASKYYQHFQKIQLTGDGRTDTVALALSQMGYHEGSSTSDLSGSSSSNGNFTEYNWNLGAFMTGGYNYEWCATFCSWALFQAGQVPHGTGTRDLCRYHDGLNGDTLDTNYIWREVGCSPWVYNLKKAGRWKYSKYYGGSYAPQPGDLIFFRSAAHIGMVVYSDSSYVYTIEGNTSDASGVEPAGGGVFFKSYALNSSSIDGYGALPYKTNASAPKVDYSGANPTAGLWITNAKKDIYTDAACTVASGTVIPRFTMIEATSVAPSKKAIKVTYNGVTGYVALNSYRVVQISSNVNVDPELQAAKDKLQALVEKAAAITYKNYTDSGLSAIRTAYYNANVVLVNEDATVAQCESAYTNLNNAYNNTGINPAVDAIYVNDANVRVTNGKSIMFTPSFGTITVENASHCWTANIRAKWDSNENAYIVLGVTTGDGVGGAPAVTLSDGEIMIAVHDWETGVTDGTAVVGSQQNQYNAWKVEEGGYKMVLNGIDPAKGTVDIGAYIAFERLTTDPDITIDGNVVYKRPYTSKGIYADESGAVPYPDDNNSSMTDGMLPHNDASYDNPAFAGFNAGTDDYINDGFASITVNLGKKCELNKFIAHVGSKYNAGAGISAPSTVEFHVSDDGKNWKKAGSVNPVDTDMTSNVVAMLELAAPVYGSYVQYRFIGSSNWIMVSEVEAYGVEATSTPGGDIVDPPVDDPNEDEVCEHTPDSRADCTDNLYCIDCGEFLAGGKDHTDEWVVIYEAEIGKEGLKQKICSECGTITDEKVIPALVDESFKLGDINESGEIDSMDYILLKRNYFGTYKFSERQFKIGDINDSGEIDSMDYILLKRAYFGTYTIK